MSDPGEDETLIRVARIVADTFPKTDAAAVGRDTTSADVPGWDSLSYTFLIMNVEEAFGIEIPLDEAYRLANVGELARLIDTLQSADS